MKTRSWIAVASAEHVRIGRAQGFMQVCHGKAALLRRLSPGDRVVYRSPTGTFRGSDVLRAFTAIGSVVAGPPYQAAIGGGFRPYRRNVHWCEATVALIRPLLRRLDLASGDTSWGYRFRFGLFEITDADMQTIARAMGAVL